jgi:6-phosphofructo-2-kinase/fructose-2,6-biphosphatase 2
MYNVGGQIGGDSDLSPQGWKYAQALPALIKENVGEDANLEVCSPSLYAWNSADR